MWKSLLALSLATLEVTTPASTQEAPRRSFEETLKFVPFGDPTKSESIHTAADGTTTQFVRTESDEKACSAGVIIQEDGPQSWKKKATLAPD